jgi:hypothetical protein
VDEKFALLLALSLFGCGGGGGGGNNSPAPLAPIPVSIIRSGIGCLLSSNADAEVNYAAGADQAKTLLWSCASMNALTRVGVEAFYTFDNAQQCYFERAMVSKGADCSRRATAPSSPMATGSIRMANTPTLVFLGGTSYALQPLDVEVSATGNMTLFGLSVEVASHTVHFGATNPGNADAVADIGDQSLSGLRHLFAGQTQFNGFVPLVTHDTSPGDSYTFSVKLRTLPAAT